MSLVRVRVEMRGVRLEFEGSESFFDAHIAALVHAVQGRPIADPVATAPDADRSDGGREPMGGADPADASPAEGAAASTIGRPPSAAEGFVPSSGHFGKFLGQVGPRAKSPAQQVVAFAFYLWNAEELRHFSPAQIEGCFRAIGLPTPDDLDACLDDLMEQKRFIQDVGIDGDYELTQKGINYVKTRLLSGD